MEGAEQMTGNYGQPSRSGYDAHDAVAVDRIPARVLAHLEELEHMVKGLDAEIENLEIRLAPVLVPSPPHAVLSDPREEVAQSHVADQVETAWRRLNELRVRLRTITERVEV